MKIKFIAILICLYALISMSGCSQNEEGSNDMNSIKTYRDIEGVTEKEIADIEDIIASCKSLTYGITLEPELLVLPDGSNVGFTAHFCKLLTELFGIEFKPEFYEESSDMMDALKGNSLDFVNDYMNQDTQDNIYHMHLPILEYPLKIFMLGNTDPFIKETDVNGLKIGFLEDRDAVSIINKYYPELSFEAVNISGGFSDLAEMLQIGEIDMFILDSVAGDVFNEYDFIQSKEFFPLSAMPVMLTTTNPKLASILTVMDKYISTGGYDVISKIYKQGQEEYAAFKLSRLFSFEESAYLDNLKENSAEVFIGLEHDNYPISFYNENENEFQGMVLDILDHISRLTDIQFNIKTTKDSTFSEMIGMLETRDISIVSHLLYSKERVKNFIWSNPFDTAYCIFISKTDTPSLKLFQVPLKKVGILKGSAYEEMYSRWFPGASNVVLFDTQEDNIRALEKGEIDLILEYEYTLLSQINYYEKSGFKINIMLDESLDSMLGFNKNEETLRSIINKTLGFIDTASIASDWKSRIFDYSYEYSRIRTIYVTVLSCVLICVLIMVVILLIKNKQLSKGLEKTVMQRTYDLEKQTTTLGSTMEELSAYNDLLLILQGEASIFEIYDGVTSRIRDISCADKVTLAQRVYAANPSYRIVSSYPKTEDGELIIYDEDVHAKIQASEHTLLNDGRFKGVLSSSAATYILNLKEWDGLIIIEYLNDDKKIEEREENIIIKYAVLFENLINKKVSQAAMEQILNSIDAMIYVSELGTDKILFVNKKMKESYGIDDAKGKICWQVFQTGMDRTCEFCPIYRLTDEYSQPVVWEEHSLVTGEYYHNTDRLIRWIDNSLVHIQLSMNITEIKETEKTLKETMTEQSAFNRLLSILQSELNTIDAIVTITATLRDIFGCYDVIVMQQMDDDEGYRQTASSLGIVRENWENNNQISSMIEHSKITCLHKDDIHDLNQGIETVYMTGVSGINSVLILEFTEKNRLIIEQEERLLVNCVTLLESLFVRKNIEDERSNFAVNLEQKVAIRTEELRIMTQEAEEAREAAYEASKAKSHFLANMSHEIRTPLNAVIGITELLLCEKLDNRKMKYVSEIYTSAKSLLGIINDILDLSKINEGKFKLVPIDSDISIMLKNVASLMSFSTRAKGLDFIEEINVDADEFVCIDETRVKQVLFNLLSNAIKFTSSGYVKFAAKIEDGDIVLDITDTGIGIKSQDQQMIFSAFEQADMRKNHAIKGTGLGLYITKSLVEMMGGNIWYESKYGSGTNFHVRIPYIKGERPDEQHEGIIDDSLMAPTAYVLIVDDIQVNLTVAAGLLRLYGISSDMAMSGKRAMELITENDYDIIFMDHMMPEEDGIEVTNRIRKLGGKYEKLPIIALTANALSEARDLLLNSGMDDFLSKPIERNDLLMILKKWLPTDKVEITSRRTEKAQNNEYSEILQKVMQIEGMDINSALKRLGGMQDILEQSIKQMSTTMSDKLHIMDKSLSDNDMKRFSIEAHGLKSSLANIGASEYSIIASELEAAADQGDSSQCADKFALFASLIEELSAEFKGILAGVYTREASQETGDVGLLIQKAEEAIQFLDNFETDEALACIDELLNFTYGDETDNLLAKVEKYIELYENEEAIQVLKQIIR